MVENNQLLIEVLVAIVVILLQLFFFFATSQRILALKDLFPKKSLDDSFLELIDSPNGTLQVIRIDKNLFSNHFAEIIDSTNKYLKKNHGATDFAIIKSIAERSIDSRENAVTSNISLPLYIGLMGTFTGIILGLLQIAFGGGVTDENINSFVGGVVIAMTASFFGLLLTVVNNSKNFKQAKTICDERKNNFFNFLQIELLPYLGNSLFDALDKLKYNINDFNTKFENNIQLFDSKFSDNISSLRSSVQSLSDNIGLVVDNTNTQKDFLVELKKIGYTRMAEANIKVFQLLKETGPTFISFIEKQKELAQSVEHASQFVHTIESILNRVKTFEESLNNLGEMINTRQYLGNDILKRIDANLNHLDKNFELLKRFEDSTANDIENYFRNKYSEIQRLTDNIKREVETALEINIENNPLQKLHLLTTIDQQLHEIKSKINLNGEFKKISDDLISSKAELINIKNNLNEAIEDNKINSAKIAANRERKVKENYAPKSKKSILIRFTNIFNRNRGRKK